MVHPLARLGPDREIHTTLDHGCNVVLRPITMADKPLIAKAIHDLSDHSRYMRFFSAFADAPEPVLEILSSVDGEKHIAWGAIDMDVEGGRPFAAVHAIRRTLEEKEVEIACTVLDEYHGHGVSHLLMGATLLDCMEHGIYEGHADVLRSNKKASRLFRGIGSELIDEGELLYFQMDFPKVIKTLEEQDFPPAMLPVLKALRTQHT